MTEEKSKEKLNNIENDKKNEDDKAKGPEFLENVPEEIKKMIEIGFSMQRFSGPLPPQFLSKLNEEHISKILDLSERDDQRTFQDTQSARKYTLVYIIIAAALFVFATIFLVNKDSELYKEVLKFLIIFAGGVGSGYGLRQFVERKKE